MARPIFYSLLATCALLLVVAMTAAQTLPQNQPEPQSAAPKGFDVQREQIDRGKLETVEYDSKTVAAKRKMVVYTPPGYSATKKYPVLYLLHGAKYNETSWANGGGAANIILDNLYADKKLTPMLVVMPNGLIPAGSAKGKGAAAFESELLNDVMPLAESRFSIQKDAEHRALAGFSMGGGQSLPIGLAHLDKFAWLAGFSPAIQGKANLVPSPEDAKKIKLLYLSCGDADSFFATIKNYHTSLDKAKVGHVWNVVPGGEHNFGVWKTDLYLFSQLIFKGKGGVKQGAAQE